MYGSVKAVQDEERFEMSVICTTSVVRLEHGRTYQSERDLSSIRNENFTKCLWLEPRLTGCEALRENAGSHLVDDKRLRLTRCVAEIWSFTMTWMFRVI